MLRVIGLLTLTGGVFPLIVPSPVERAQIITKLTNIRENVQPPASNMNMLSYFEEMEQLAVNWVSKCSFVYPSRSTCQALAGTGMLLKRTANSKLRFQGVGRSVISARTRNVTTRDIDLNSYKVVSASKLYLKLTINGTALVSVLRQLQGLSRP
uniref:Lipocalin n=1 Tax=Mesocestoides corti TaxID=53468 RepID=A0A5K3FZE3_MESCO